MEKSLKQREQLEGYLRDKLQQLSQKQPLVVLLGKRETMNNYFMGQDGFNWFVGVVEDRQIQKRQEGLGYDVWVITQQTFRRFPKMTCLGHP